MKKICFVMSLLALCACSNKMDIQYKDSTDGCEYSEVHRPRGRLIDFFGKADSDLYVSYGGVGCKAVLDNEMSKGIHKTMYNNLPIFVSEVNDSNITTRH